MHLANTNKQFFTFPTKRAKYFISCNQLTEGHKDLLPSVIRNNILAEKHKRLKGFNPNQLLLFDQFYE